MQKRYTLNQGGSNRYTKKTAENRSGGSGTGRITTLDQRTIKSPSSVRSKPSVSHGPIQNVETKVDTEKTQEVKKGENGETVIVEKQIITTTKTITELQREEEEKKKKLKANKGPKERRKSLVRGDDYANILITHILMSSNPKDEIHITDPLDYKHVDDPIKDWSKMRKSGALKGKKGVSTSFYDSCKNWRPKEKDSNPPHSMVYQFYEKKRDNHELDGSIEPYNRQVKVRATKDFKTNKVRSQPTSKPKTVTSGRRTQQVDRRVKG